MGKKSRVSVGNPRSTKKSRGLGAEKGEEREKTSHFLGFFLFVFWEKILNFGGRGIIGDKKIFVF